MLFCLAAMKWASSVLLTVFIGKAKHKSSKMADVHNLINIPRQVCQSFPSGSLPRAILVITPLLSACSHLYASTFLINIQIDCLVDTVYMSGLLNYSLINWLKRLRELQATSLSQSYIHLLSGTLLCTVVRGEVTWKPSTPPRLSGKQLIMRENKSRHCTRSSILPGK